MVKGPVLCVVTALLLTTGSAAGAGQEHPVQEHVDLTLVKKSGTTKAGTVKYQHKGSARGTVDGTVRSKITIKNSVSLHGTVTIATAQGRVRIAVDGRARSLGMRVRFDGGARLTGGTGKYAGTTGTGTFFGVVNRRTWHVTIDATGSYHY
jgi:hypothetical protein